MVGKMINKELFDALRMFEKEKDIPMDYMLQQIQKAIEIACKSYYGGNENVVFKADPEKNSFDVKLVKTVVDEVTDPNFEVTPEEAAQINKRKKYAVGDEIDQKPVRLPERDLVRRAGRPELRQRLRGRNAVPSRRILVNVRHKVIRRSSINVVAKKFRTVA